MAPGWGVDGATGERTRRRGKTRGGIPSYRMDRGSWGQTGQHKGCCRRYVGKALPSSDKFRCAAEADEEPKEQVRLYQTVLG